MQAIVIKSYNRKLSLGNSKQRRDNSLLNAFRIFLFHFLVSKFASVAPKKNEVERVNLSMKVRTLAWTPADNHNHKDQYTSQNGLYKKSSTM